MHVLIVGSSVVDLFLTVDKDYIAVSDDKVSFSLGDKIPSEIKKMALGGNGANVSVGLTRLTIPTTFYTYMGNDILSRKIEENLTKEGVELVTERKEGNNSPLHIIVDFDKDRIIFSHYQKAEHGFSYDESYFDFIYLTSIADYWKNAYQKILSFAKQNRIPIAFSPGTRQLDDTDGIFFEVLKHSEMLFVNKEEAEHILRNAHRNFNDINSVLSELKQQGSKVVSITDGANGAYALGENGEAYKISSFSDEGVVEKTGAGDAYAGAFFAGYLLGNSINECMRWGSFNACASMKEIGAQDGLLTKAQLGKMLEEHPEFKAEKF